jgi:CheY-like chemotaxis protein
VHTPLYAGFKNNDERLIFAVDDEATDRLMLERLLQQPGLEYGSRFFASGDEMIDALLKVLRGATPPLACFIDVKMAGMSGFDVLRWIRCQDALDAVPVIMLSSSEDPEKLTEARGVGAQCYAAKFPSEAELRAIITEARRYAEDYAGPAAFRLPCNLLLDPAAVGKSAIAGRAATAVLR